MFSVAEGTRWSTSQVVGVTMRTQSCSGMTWQGPSSTAYGNCNQCPKGPTTRMNPCHLKQTASSPHHSICTGGRVELVSKSRILVVNEVDSTVSTPLPRKQAMNRPLGAIAIFTTGAEIFSCSSWSSHPLTSTTKIVFSLVPRRTSSRPLLVKWGASTARDSTRVRSERLVGITRVRRGPWSEEEDAMERCLPCMPTALRSSTATSRQSEVSATSPAPHTLPSTTRSELGPSWGRFSNREKGGNACPKRSYTPTVPSSWMHTKVSRSLHPMQTTRLSTRTGSDPSTTPDEE
mmetsp:Transcript_52631/g.105464  ORF Transcript_52631/g.105464 Transcript_52631/m.105464 type:complete len:291 (-) Transcript_52631:306-1178(-)